MKPSPCILALDQGTTSSRAILFNHDGVALAKSQFTFKQHYPKPGLVEHDPLDIFETQRQAALDVLNKGESMPLDVRAIGITNQRETTLIWDKHTGEPIHNALVWQDRRTASLCLRLKEAGLEPQIREKTGLLLDPYFSATKIAWLLDHLPDARKKAESGDLLFGTIDSWLIWKFTGGATHATDVSNASRTLLFNIHTLTWDDTLLEIFNIPLSMLPEVKENSTMFGTVKSNDALDGLPICGVAGDQQAALFGQQCFTPGMAKNTYGTGCFLLMNLGDSPIASNHNLLTTVAWKRHGVTTYALEGAVFVAGAVVQWLRDELELVESAEACSALAASVPDSGGLIIVPAFTGLGAPHWDPDARGICVGITRGTNRAHFCRAAIESIAYQSAELISCMESDAGTPLTQLMVDGGATESEVLMQFQADLLQKPVLRPECIETTALGAAFLAGLAIGFWETRSDLPSVQQKGTSFNPHTHHPPLTLDRWKKAVQRARCWEEEDHS